MKKYFYLGMMAASLFCLSSCGDDDAPEISTDQNSGQKEEATSIGIKNVFEEGLPAQSSNYEKIEMDENGRVTMIKGHGETAIFNYSDATRASDPYDVMITIKEDTTVTSVLYCQINKEGFIYEVLQKYSDGDTDTWRFEYENKYLTKMVRSEGDNEVTTITYNADHDITKVTIEDDDKNHSEYTIFYTDSTTAEPIANKACFMLFDDTYQVDMDEMYYAYFAGLLGKATAHLPIGYVSNRTDKYQKSLSFKWTINVKGLPTKLVAIDNVYGYVDFEHTWTW